MPYWSISGFKDLSDLGLSPKLSLEFPEIGIDLSNVACSFENEA